MSVLQSETVIATVLVTSTSHLSPVICYEIPITRTFFRHPSKVWVIGSRLYTLNHRYTLPKGHLLFHIVLHLCKLSWNLLFITSHQSAILFRILLWIVRKFCTRLEQSRHFPQVHATLVTWFSLSVCFGKSAAFTGGSLWFWALIKEKELK